MSAEDDPEQRIRDLERSLSDRASELGVSSPETASAGRSAATGGAVEYGYVDAPAPTYIPPQDAYPPPPPGASSYSMHPPPPPPGAYGSPFPPPPPQGAYSTPPVMFGSPVVRRSSSSTRLGWLIFAIPVFILVMIGFSFFAFFQAADDVTSQFDSFQSAVPSIAFPDADATPPTVTEGGSVSVAGTGRNQDIACDGGAVTVSGVSNTVTITGHCATVIVSGIENTVIVDSADVITASGITNRVKFLYGTPETSSTGDNVIERG